MLWRDIPFAPAWLFLVESFLALGADPNGLKTGDDGGLKIISFHKGPRRFLGGRLGLGGGVGPLDSHETEVFYS